jgi:LysR family pca operon transcriptional activator
MVLDFRQLKYLLTIAREGSFSRAAAALRMSQPALSTSISQLERRIGTSVLSRGRHGASLTAAGKLLVRNAEIVEVQMSRASEELRYHNLSAEGPLVIGITPVAGADLVPRALARLRQKIPNAAVSVFEMVFSEAMPALLTGRIDLMVGPVGVYPTVPGIIEEPLATDPFSIVVASRHELSSRRTLSLRQVGQVHWVLPNDQSAFHRQIESLFVVAGLGWPTAATLTNSMSAIKSIVMHGDGVSVMPRQLVAIERRAGLLHCIKLAEAGATRALGLSRPAERKLSPLAETFAQIVRACATN